MVSWVLNMPLPHCSAIISQPAITCSKSAIETLEQRCEICSKLTIKTPKRRRRRFGVFITNFEHILHVCSSVSIVNFEHAIKIKNKNSLLGFF